jgi:hypothetical protein
MFVYLLQGLFRKYSLGGPEHDEIVAAVELVHGDWAHPFTTIGHNEIMLGI